MTQKLPTRFRITWNQDGQLYSVGGVYQSSIATADFLRWLSSMTNLTYLTTVQTMMLYFTSKSNTCSTSAKKEKEKEGFLVYL